MADLFRPDTLLGIWSSFSEGALSAAAWKGLFRPDPYDDSTVDDIAALDPRLKILQSRTEYRSDASATMQTSSEELFDMRDDGAVYGGGAALQ